MISVMQGSRPVTPFVRGPGGKSTNMESRQRMSDITGNRGSIPRKLPAKSLGGRKLIHAF